MKPRQRAMPVGGAQVEVDARVHAAVAEVAVERAGVVVACRGGARNSRRYVAQPLGRHRGVFPALPRVALLAGHARGRAEARFAHEPQVLLLVSSSNSFIDGACGRVASRAMSARALASDSALSSPPNSTISQPLPSGSSSVSSGWMCFFFMSSTSRSSSPSSPMQPDARISTHVIGRFVDARIAEHEQRAMPGPRHQAQRRLEHGDARALGADERARHVEPVLRQQLVERCSRRRGAESSESARGSGARSDRRSARRSR